MLDLIITFVIILLGTITLTVYVNEYREISLHKKAMEAEWNKYIEEPMSAKGNATSKENILF